MLIGLVVATAITTAVGFLIVGPLDATLGSADLEVVEELVEARTDHLDRATAITGLLADAGSVAVLWALAMAVGARLTRRWEAAVFLLFAVGGEKLTFLVSSLVVDRPRPPVEALGHVFETGAFPSGHVGSAVTL